ncbi:MULTISPECIES: hypothetical protein [Streptacidiphilus]|uniref:LPXTG cell wall anchor domain-containing protein n=1 Tax=Streptacidiphilus cavernicola TaxID=3342716 RepID=A0ABV6UP54_9ACTN|nr:hypothetical protein [Streptacidiphilus jeojiense]
MYNKVASGVGASSAGGATLATTGTNLMWLFLAAFALLAVGTAVLRIVPRRRRRR